MKTAPWDRALEGKRGQRKLIDIQGSPPSDSRNIHPEEQGVTRKCQEADIDENGDPGKTQTQKESNTKLGSRNRQTGRSTEILPEYAEMQSGKPEPTWSSN